MEMIPDQTLINNVNASPNTKAAFGISGRLNRNGNDGTVSRFGWKAQNQSLLLFSGEAYNVEMGISNELFQVERDENATLPVRVVAERRDQRRRTAADGYGQRGREVRVLHALPGAADSVDERAGRFQLDLARPPAVHARSAARCATRRRCAPALRRSRR